MWDRPLTASDVSALCLGGAPAETIAVERAVQILNVSSADSPAAADAQAIFDDYPSVLSRLLRPVTGQMDTSQLTRRSPLQAGSLLGNAELRSSSENKILDGAYTEVCIGDAQSNMYASNSSVDWTSHFSGLTLSDFTVPYVVSELGGDVTLAASLYEAADKSDQACDDVTVRINRYADAITAGVGKSYGESLYKWAMLRSFGVEVSIYCTVYYCQKCTSA